ncbi:hypothetical protein QDR37_04750 [Amnibacterium sp. CER49]|uniref:hypothetical protein n=1 Tax=Amnibacterium sp. CER49 TaxID=3039161 RepID=UPI00244BC677|nr:hypothetical protein [Amnibacterium sp. CER49]MDH2443250.1 hypothetical protein [Amnibacterium sp. CER49]
MKRISMAGSDIAVTDGRIAAALLDYAMHLGQSGTTDTVTLPVAANGRVQEASLLLGPASEIAVTDNNDVSLEGVELPGVEAVVAELERRVHVLTGQRDEMPGDPGDVHSAFVDFEDPAGRQG